jgi:prepilin-type processing-associated H-X9-DG protein
LPPALETGGNNNAAIMASSGASISLYVCPSRRSTPAKNIIYGGTYWSLPVGDYAILTCPTGGASEWTFEAWPAHQMQPLRMASIPGVAIYADSVLNSTNSSPAQGSTSQPPGGFTSWQSRDPFSRITDGLSNTAMIAEKFIPAGRLGNCCNGGWTGSGNGSGNDGYLYWGPRSNGPGGYGGTWVAGSVLRPLSKGPSDGNGLGSNNMPTLGSWHAGIVNFLFVDGSVHAIGVNTSVSVISNLGNVSDGVPIDLPF